jgi:hypothetical protein
MTSEVLGYIHRQLSVPCHWVLFLEYPLREDQALWRVFVVVVKVWVGGGGEVRLIRLPMSRDDYNALDTVKFAAKFADRQPPRLPALLEEWEGACPMADEHRWSMEWLRGGHDVERELEER